MRAAPPQSLAAKRDGGRKVTPTGLTAVAAFSLSPGQASAHAAEQGFVLLLPTGAYTAAGVAVVALTVLLLFAMPAGGMRRLFAARPLAWPRLPGIGVVTSLVSLAAMTGAVWLGLFGPRDPLSNLLPLGVWTVGWVAVLSLSGLLGNLWSWLNPWTGLYALLGRPGPLIRVPERLGMWPAVPLLAAFAAFLLADVAPDDPGRLARFIAGYWAAGFALLLAVGPAAFRRIELGHALLGLLGRLSPFRWAAPGGVGGPGWRLVARPVPAGAGALALTFLAVGSFDGLNETFWWMARIGVNPLEFPGRSAVILPTLAGLAAAIAALFAVFSGCVWLGLWLVGEPAAAPPAVSRGHRSAPPAHPAFADAFARLSLATLPIALGYHVAHYFPGFLVNIQYVAAALTDPLGRGADLLGFGEIRVTTGFFNQMGPVRAIWLTQAGAVVLGHAWSILLAHRMALDLAPRGATRLTLPLSVFMVGYTCLGLWLLAAPRGA